MRRIWRWRLCAIGWVGGAYLCLLTLMSVINITSIPRMQLEQKYARNRETQTNPSSSVWRGTMKRKLRVKGMSFSWCHNLRWVNPPGPTTALISFPGSGNTWLRYLIQQATGFYTGSVYKDFALLKNGFPAESVCNGSVVVIKTHEFGLNTRSIFSRGILILRDPYESIKAEFNRQSAGHIGHAPNEKYRKDKGEYWHKFAKVKAVGWMNTTMDWLNFNGPLHIVFYSDLLSDLSAEMIKIFTFLQISVTPDEFTCMMKHQGGIYRRKKKDLPFNPFGRHLQKWVETCKVIVGRSLKQYLTQHSMKEALSRYRSSFFNSSYM